MSSASTPPMRKNTSADAPYMMPTFLWSTPNSHAFQPPATSGRAKTPRDASGAVVSVAAGEGEGTVLGDLGDGHQLPASSVVGVGVRWAGTGPRVIR